MEERERRSPGEPELETQRNDDEDVEAHRKSKMATDEGTTDEGTSDDDVELHRKSRM